MRWLALTLVLLASPAIASTPTGQSFGAWHVSSINSVSGGAGDDASAGLQQQHGCTPEGYDCSTLSISWMQGSDVYVSVSINECRNDEEFEAAFAVPIDRWLKAGRKMETVIERAFQTWLAEARMQCVNSKNVDAFKMPELKSAVRNLTQRISTFAN